MVSYPVYINKSSIFFNYIHVNSFITLYNLITSHAFFFLLFYSNFALVRPGKTYQQPGGTAWCISLSITCITHLCLRKGYSFSYSTFSDFYWLFSYKKKIISNIIICVVAGISPKTIIFIHKSLKYSSNLRFRIIIIMKFIQQHYKFNHSR